jgi:hypothetical protein
MACMYQIIHMTSLKLWHNYNSMYWFSRKPVLSFVQWVH